MISIYSSLFFKFSKSYKPFDPRTVARLDLAVQIRVHGSVVAVDIVGAVAVDDAVPLDMGMGAVPRRIASVAPSSYGPWAPDTAVDVVVSVELLSCIVNTRNNSKYTFVDKN